MKNWKMNLVKEDEVRTCFEKRLRLAKLILKKLELQPLRWTPLLKDMIQVCGSPPRLYYILKFLEKNGFVCRTLVDGKSHWSITDNGKELLKVLSADRVSLKT